MFERFRRRRHFSNREGIQEYDFALSSSGAEAGVSAMVRVKNEEQKISYCLRSILPVFDEIVLIDNASDDATLNTVREIKERLDTQAKISILCYPFKLARFGPEHEETPEDSLHSAVYYTNWALSQCSYRYVCKWDGDMVLKRDMRTPFRDFLERMQSSPKACWRLSGQTVYRDLRGEYFLAKGEVNNEIEIFPNSPTCRFGKSQHWESLNPPPRLPVNNFPPVCFFELKFVDEDEFSHWSTREWPSKRKQREWLNFNLVKEGSIDSERFEALPAMFLDDAVR